MMPQGFLEAERKRKLGIVDPPRGGADAMELPEPRISPTQWFKFIMTHQAMLFPAFNMQRILQKRILGVSFWDKQTKRRKQMNQVHVMIEPDLCEYCIATRYSITRILNY